MATESQPDVVGGAELRRDTNWWGAFVVGLAGTILVTGVTGPVLAGMGSAALPNFLVVSATGWLLCLFLAELAAMMPERTGGAPAYAYAAFVDRMPRAYPHINGVTSWMYWLGWMPVLAVNMLLVGSYLIALLHIPTGPELQLFGQPAVPLSTLVVGAALSVALYIPAYFGIRFGAALATILGLLSVASLTVIVVLPLFHLGAAHAGNVFPFVTPSGASLFSGTGIGLSIQYWALLSWNVIAFEAAACYIAECRNPHRDAPIAMNLEGGFGVFIYTLLPLSMLAVLGVSGIKSDPLALFSTFAEKVVSFPGLNYVVTAALVVALLLSSLNAIMGCARSIYQMSRDGQGPRWMGRLNKHDVPAAAMGLNVVLNIAIMLFGAPAVIYVFSNVGYVGSFVPVLLAYFFMRQWRPNAARPFRLPDWMKWVALGLAAFYAFVWLVGLPWCAFTGCATGGGNNLIAYFVGLLVVLAYFPLQWWRRWEDRRAAAAETEAAVVPAE